jgi:uncharacterized protein YdhG (YjbR/CyaY superfamily)
MLKVIDQFYLDQKEPLQSTLLALREIILSLDARLTDSMKYGMPFFCYQKKMFCYFWVDKKTKEPYIGVVKGHLLNHPNLEKGDRKQIKIFRINTQEDLPVETIKEILNEALSYYYV